MARSRCPNDIGIDVFPSTFGAVITDLVLFRTGALGDKLLLNCTPRIDAVGM
jgi:hypothetical protein